MECIAKELKEIYKIENKFITYGLGEYDKSEFQRIKNRNFIKPYGGLWSSPVNSDWGWKDWCLSEDFNVEKLSNSFEFSLNDNAKIYVIDEFSDLGFLVMGNKYRFVSWWGDSIILDFEKLSKVYDAILLTDKGQIDTRYTNPGLYGWDCESILVMNPDCIVM